MPVRTLTRSIQRLRRPLPMATELEGGQFYETYWRKRLDLEPEITTTAPGRAAIAAPYLRPGDSVLDLGCGDGSFLTCLRDLVPDLDLRGADLSETALEVAASRGLETAQLDLADPDLEIPGSYDVVISLEVIEHLPDAESVVLKAAAAARRHLIVSVPNLGFIESRLRLLAGRGPITNVVHHVREHLRQWTVRDFHEWAGALDLRVVAQHPTRPIGTLRLGERWPSLFSSGMLYVLERRG